MPFNPVGLGERIFKQRYTMEGETFSDACKRVAKHISGAEENGKRERYEEKFEELIGEGLFSPGGRVWYGAGRPKAQCSNCYVIRDPEDSREGWGRAVSDIIIISGLMGGVGLNCSQVRPRGYPIRGTGGIATGSVSLMTLINGVGDVIVGGGGRRMALMLCLDVTHPDLDEFLSVKLDRKELNNANISVVLPKDFPAETFMKMVKDGNDYDLVFGGIPSGKTMNARSLWDRLVQNAWDSGEPGMLNMHLANKMNNVHYLGNITATNPCGEQPLLPYDSCNLGALVLPNFVHDGKFDFEQFHAAIRLSVRFLDNLISVNYWPLKEIESMVTNIRRIGLGVMGLHSALLKMGMKYDSLVAKDKIHHIFRTLRDSAYHASVDLAIEKGPFPGYRPDYLHSGFVKKLPRGIKNRIEEYGIRNSHLLTCAPTGTTSIAFGVSPSIEPDAPPVHWRNFYKKNDSGERELTRELVVTQSYIDHGDIAQSALDISLESHFEVQKIVQEYIDSGVSKTICMAQDQDPEELSRLWLEYLPFCKGTTVYRYGSRPNEPINPVPREQWDSVVAEFNEQKIPKEMSIDETLRLDCSKGTCSIEPVLWSEGTLA